MLRRERLGRLGGRWLRRAGLVSLFPLVAGCALLRGREARESPSERQAREAQDARILREVETRLAGEPSIGAGRVRVVVERREVHLHGAVEGYGALRCALRNAALTRDVRLVIDLLVLEPGPSEVHCLAPRYTDPDARAGRAGPAILAQAPARA